MPVFFIFTLDLGILTTIQYFSHQLKDNNHVQYLLNLKEALTTTKSGYRLMELHTVNLSDIIE